MATLKITGKVSPTKQGWYSSTGATSGTNNSLKIVFPSSTQVKDYTFTKATLKLECAGGKNDKHSFAMTFSNSSSLDGTYSTTGSAYNTTASINFNGKLSQLQSWFANGGTTLTSKDPSPKTSHSATDGGRYSENYTIVKSAVFEIEYNLNASSATFSSTSMGIGKSYTANITANNTAYTHSLVLVAGGSTTELFSGVAGGSISFAIPTSFGSTVLPNSTSTSASLTLNTYNSGTLIGTKSYSITLTADEDNCDPAVSLSFNKDTILGGVTQVTFAAKATGKYGATIKTYTLAVPGLSAITSATNTFTVVMPNSGGKKTVAVTVTDSRGYSTTAYTDEFYVNSYTVPYFSTVSLYRCKADGTKDDISGTYAKVVYSSVVSSVLKTDGTTAVSNTGTVSFTLNGTTYNTNTVIGGSFLTDTAYYGSITIKDTMGYSSVIALTLPSSSYLLHFREGQNSVGIGCAAENIGTSESQVTIGWPLVLKNTITLNSALPLSSGGTGVSATSNTGLLESLGAVKKVGDTMSGALILNNTLSVSNAATFKGSLIVKNDTTYPQMQFYCSDNEVIKGLVGWNNNSSRMFFRNYNGSTSIYEDFRLPSVSATSATSYDILTTKDYYKIEDIITEDTAFAWGWITANSKGLSLVFPLSPNFSAISSVEILSLKGNIRGLDDSKYIVPSGSGSYVEGGTDFTSIIDKVFYIKTQNVLYIHASLTSATSQNNRVIQFDGTLSFKITE